MTSVLTIFPLASTSIFLQRVLTVSVNVMCIMVCSSIRALLFFSRLFQTFPGLERRLTQRSFKEAPLNALLDVNEGLSQDPYRAADHLRSPTAAARGHAVQLQLLQPGTNTHTQYIKSHIEHRQKQRKKREEEDKQEVSGLQSEATAPSGCSWCEQLNRDIWNKQAALNSEDVLL